MPNKNYVAGRNFEYARKKEWSSRGYIVLRTAGSHGPFDLVGIHPSYPVALIQCKRVETPPQANRLLNEFRNNPPLSTFGKYHQVMEVYVKTTRKVLTTTV